MPSEQTLSSARHLEGTAGKKGHRRGQSDVSTRYPGDVPPDSDGSLTLPRNTRGPGAELGNLPPTPNTRGPRTYRHSSSHLRMQSGSISFPPSQDVTASVILRGALSLF